MEKTEDKYPIVFNRYTVLNRKVFTIILLAIIASILYGYQLHFPPEIYYDEVYHVQNARALIEGEGYYDTHPPLGKEIIASGILALGDKSWAWRISGMLFGAGVAVLLYTIPVALLKNRFIGLTAYFLCLLDGLCFTQARIAMSNSTCAFFMLLSVFFLIQYYPLQRWPSRRAFLASGASFGAMLATKWFALLLVPLLGMWVAVGFYREKNKPQYILEVLLSFILLPALICILSYIPVAPMFAQGFLSQLKFIFTNQFTIWNYHKAVHEFHLYQSEWWKWLFMARPVWYVFEKTSAGMIRGIVALGNPAVFTFILPGCFFGLSKILSKKADPGQRIYCIISLTGFLFCYIPWAFQPRSTIYFHYFYFALLFALLLEALLFHSLWKSNRIGKITFIIILASILVLFFYFLPLLNGLPISETAFRNRMWFKSWI